MLQTTSNQGSEAGVGGVATHRSVHKKSIEARTDAQMRGEKIDFLAAKWFSSSLVRASMDRGPLPIEQKEDTGF